MTWYEQAIQLLDTYKPVWMPLWLAILVALFIIRTKLSLVARLIRGGVTIAIILFIAYLVTQKPELITGFFDNLF